MNSVLETFLQKLGKNVQGGNSCIWWMTGVCNITSESSSVITFIVVSGKSLPDLQGSEAFGHPQGQCFWYPLPSFFMAHTVLVSHVAWNHTSYYLLSTILCYSITLLKCPNNHGKIKLSHFTGEKYDAEISLRH